MTALRRQRFTARRSRVNPHILLTRIATSMRSDVNVKQHSNVGLHLNSRSAPAGGPSDQDIGPCKRYVCTARYPRPVVGSALSLADLTRELECTETIPCQQSKSPAMSGRAASAPAVPAWPTKCPGNLESQLQRNQSGITTQVVSAIRCAGARHI